MRYNSFKTRTNALAQQAGVTLSSLRETAAKALGFHDLHDLQKRLDQDGPQRELVAAAEEIARCYRLETTQVIACLDPASATPAVRGPGRPLASFGLWDVYGDCLEHRRSGYWINAERLLERRNPKSIDLLDWPVHMLSKGKDMRDGFDQAFTFALSHLLPAEQQPNSELLSGSLDYFNEHKAFRDAYEQEQAELRGQLRANGDEIAKLGIMSFKELVSMDTAVLSRLQARGIEEPQTYDCPT